MLESDWTSRSSLDAEVFERQAVICRAFAHPQRLHLLDMLGRGEQRHSVLQKTMGVSKANFSQHLAILKAAGVVSTRRNGRETLCSLASPEVKQACHLIRQVLRSQTASSIGLPEEIAIWRTRSKLAQARDPSTGSSLPQDDDMYGTG